MPSAKSDGGYRLPLVVDPERLCVTVPIPDDQFHRLAFLGQLDALARWHTWERDAAHTGAAVALVWRQIYEFVRHQLDTGASVCGDVMDVRQNPEMPCILEKTYDGLTWVEFADLRLCTPLLRRNPLTGRVEASSDGETWTPIPEADTGPFDPAEPTVPPPPRPEATSQERVCNAAANAARVLKMVYEDVARRLSDEVATENELAAAIGGVLYVALALLGISETATAIGIASVLGVVALQNQYRDNPLNSDHEEGLKCLLNECGTDTGGIVTFDWGCFYDGLAGADNWDTTRANLMNLITEMVGVNALNAAGAVQNLVGQDCSACNELFLIASPDSPNTVIELIGENRYRISGGDDISGNWYHSFEAQGFVCFNIGNFVLVSGEISNSNNHRLDCQDQQSFGFGETPLHTANAKQIRIRWDSGPGGVVEFDATPA